MTPGPETQAAKSPSVDDPEMHNELDVITTNLKNAKSVWGLGSKQYRACEEILIDYLRDSADKRAALPEHELAKGVLGSSSGLNLPFRPAK
ncbi:hypothetical protein XANCAGTX0491_005085 [Xanthoria calcicola]